jgi:hypothetical protein
MAHSTWRPFEVMHLVVSPIFYVTRIMVYSTWRPCEAMHVSSVLDILYQTHNGLFHMTTLRGHACELWEGRPTWKSYKIIPHEGLVAPSKWVMWETFHVRPTWDYCTWRPWKAIHAEWCETHIELFHMRAHVRTIPCERYMGLFNTRARTVTPRVVLMDFTLCTPYTF